MAGKVIIGILVAIGVMAVCAAVFRYFWGMVLIGGPLALGVMVAVVFLLGVFLGSYLR